MGRVRGGGEIERGDTRSRVVAPTPRSDRPPYVKLSHPLPFHPLHTPHQAINTTLPSIPDAGRGGPASSSSSSSSAAPTLTLASSPPPDAPLLELVDVHKSFGAKPILKGASITIKRGEAVGIIGGSGTGKSTTLRLLAGLLEPDAGTVRVLGTPRSGLLADDPDLADTLRVGLVFQNGALFDSLTVGENVGFSLYEHSALPPAVVKEAVADALASVGLSGVENLYPSELSGGMRKRVALARAIVRPPASALGDSVLLPEQVIMYDEPTAGLDPVASTVVEDLIRSLHAPGPGGRPPACSAYVVVTHQHSTIRRAVDRLIFLHGGKVVWQGTVEEFDNSTEPIVAQFRDGALDGPIKYE